MSLSTEVIAILLTIAGWLLVGFVALSWHLIEARRAAVALWRASPIGKMALVAFVSALVPLYLALWPFVIVADAIDRLWRWGRKP
jgi:hypothetical protein